ncbi:hypothetical protein DXC96_04735 [Enterocloster bolteae]|nr:hypothetical protein DXC96_04735 [Enterocloster bolteae]
MLLCDAFDIICDTRQKTPNEKDLHNLGYISIHTSVIESENPKNSYISQILVKISLNIAVFSYFSIPKKKNGINIAY